MSDVYYLEEQGDDRAVAFFREHRIGFVCSDGWYLNIDGKVSWGEAENRASAANEFFRHFTEWLYATMQPKESEEKMESAA